MPSTSFYFTGRPIMLTPFNELRTQDFHGLSPCLPTMQWPRARRLVLQDICHNSSQNINFRGFCDTNSWWKRHDCILRFVSDAILCLIWLFYQLYHGGGHRTNILTAVTHGCQSNITSCLEERQLLTQTVDIAQWSLEISQKYNSIDVKCPAQTRSRNIPGIIVLLALWL